MYEPVKASAIVDRESDSAVVGRELETFGKLVDDFNHAAETIKSYLKSPSHNLCLAATTSSEDLTRAKQALLNTTMSVQHFLSSPIDFQQQMTINYHHAAAVRWLCKFNVPSFVPATGSVSYHVLADRANVPEEQLRRILRMAMTAGVFREDVAGDIYHTVLSLQMYQDSSYTDTILFMTETNMPIASRLVEMTEQFQGSEDRTATAFNIAMQTNLPFFPYLAQNPLIAKRLASSMKQLGSGEETHIRHLINGFDWAGLGEARVIDMGASMGHVSIALADAFPDLSFVIQDLPDVISRAASQPLDSTIAGRLSFQAHNFLRPQPISSRHADVFLIRQCLQNWPRKDAVTILKNVVPFLGPTSVIVIMNVILPEPGSCSVREEALGRVRDMYMMQAMNGQERDLTQWHDLLHDVDPLLKIKNVVKPRGSVLSVIEVAMSG